MYRSTTLGRREKSLPALGATRKRETFQLTTCCFCRSLAFVKGWTALESLVVDSNELSNDAIAANLHLPNLSTLSINANKIDDLAAFLSTVAQACPALTFLSMLKNPCCPNFFTGKDQEDYQRYRLFVVSALPGLRFLDSSRVSDEERAEAERVGRFQKVCISYFISAPDYLT